MTLIDALTHVLKRSTSAVFEPLLTAVLPALLQDPAFEAFPTAFVKHVPQDGDPAWGTMLQRLLEPYPSDNGSIRHLLNALGPGSTHAVLGMVIWDRLGALMDEQQVTMMLTAALRYDWPDLVDRLLASPRSTDLSKTLAYHNPFNAVQSPDDLDRLLRLGFNPWQPSQNGPSGDRLMSQRGVDAFRRRLPSGRWTQKGAKEAMVKRLQADHPVPLLDRFVDALKFHTEWCNLEPMLNAFGEGWMNVLPEEGGTVLHIVAVHRPHCLPYVLQRPEVRARGLAWSMNPDAAGRHPWELVWLNRHTAQNPVHESRSVMALEAQLNQEPWCCAWLAGVPHRPDLQGLSMLLDAAVVWKKPLPSFNHTPWWDWQVNHGGVGADNAWALAMNQPELLERLDRLVWEVLEPRQAHDADAWFNLDLWSSASHPWLATYRLMSSLLFLHPKAAPDTVEEEMHQHHARRAIQAINDGADVPTVQRRIEAGHLALDDERRSMWHRELCSMWEQRVLRENIATTTSVDSALRRRL